MRCLIVRNGAGYKIVEAGSARYSGLVSSAPAGIFPGEEEFLTVTESPNGIVVSFDYEARDKAQVKARETTVLGRWKSAIKP